MSEVSTQVNRRTYYNCEYEYFIVDHFLKIQKDFFLYKELLCDIEGMSEDIKKKLCDLSAMLHYKISRRLDSEYNILGLVSEIKYKIMKIKKMNQCKEKVETFINNINKG